MINKFSYEYETIKYSSKTCKLFKFTVEMLIIFAFLFFWHSIIWIYDSYMLLHTFSSVSEYLGFTGNRGCSTTMILVALQ